jgi:hypothetical protein
MKPKLYILVLNNGAKLSDEQYDSLCDYIYRKTPFEAVIEQRDTTIPLSYDVAMAPSGFKISITSQYVREWIRDMISYNRYGIVIHLFPKDKDIDPRIVNGWTNTALYQNACLVEMCLENFEDEKEWRDIAHEFIHCFWMMLRIKFNVPFSYDTMDTYRYDDIIEHPQGNREENLKRINDMGYWPLLEKAFEAPFAIRLLEKLISLKQQLLAIVKKNETMNNKIQLFAEGIKTYEGWIAGSRSFRNRNPGNLKYFGQAGAIGKDDKGFAIFRDYESGMAALIRQITNACIGKSKIYKPEMSILEYFRIYAPSSDSNHPDKYAQFVAQKIQVDVTTKLKDLV